MEYYGRYQRTKRISMNPTIDQPVLVILGFTIFELLSATVVFISFGMFGDAPVWGLLLAIVAAFVQKKYRNTCPPRFVVHLFWSVGLTKLRNVPRFFKQRRFLELEP